MAFFQKRITEEPQGFGAQLRMLRELRGLSTSELAKRTGIHALIIQAFEEERFQELSDPVYAERHVERLVLAMDGRAPYFKNMYAEALAARGFVKDQATLLRPRLRRRDFFVGSRFVVAVGFSLLILLVGSYVTWHVLTVTAPPALAVMQPVEGEQVREPKVLITGKTEPMAFVKVNDRDAIVDPDGQFRFEMEIPSGMSTIHIEARRRNGSPIALDRHVTYTYAVSTTNPPPTSP